MNAKSLKALYEKVCYSKNPADIFDCLKTPKEKDVLLSELKTEWRELIIKCHPDKFVKEDALTIHLAEQISGIINNLYSSAVDVINNGPKPPIKIEEQPILFTITTKKNSYDIYEHMVEGEYSNIYRGLCGTDKICAKIVKETSDNSNITNEVKVMKLLKHKSLPEFLDMFKTTDGTIGLIMKELDAWDLTQVNEKLGPLSVRHTSWIFERVLSVLGFMHINKVIHGNIEPSNIMIRPRDHNAFLIDFLFSLINPVETKDTIKVYSDSFSHPDISKKKPPMPHHDLYALGKCIIYLLGGNTETNSMPNSVEMSFKKFVYEFIKPGVQDAWKKHAELHNLRLNVLGHRGFITLDGLE